MKGSVHREPQFEHRLCCHVQGKSMESERGQCKGTQIPRFCRSAAGPTFIIHSRQVPRGVCPFCVSGLSIATLANQGGPRFFDI
jgi:hypothetical protein